MSDRARDRLALSLSLSACVLVRSAWHLWNVSVRVWKACVDCMWNATLWEQLLPALCFALSLLLSLSAASLFLYICLSLSHTLSLSFSPSPPSLLSCAFSLQCVSALRFVFVLLSFVAVNSFSLLKTQIYMPTEVVSGRGGEGRGKGDVKKLHYLSHLSTSHLNMYLKNNNAPTVQK